MRRLAAMLLLASAALAQGRADLLEGVSLDQRLGEALPLDARFTDEYGREVALREYFGERPVVLALVYYECPQLCTLVLNGLSASLKTLSFDAGREFEVVAISIDPGETPELARKKKDSYLRAYGRAQTANGWHFLVGEEASIRAVTDAAGYRYRYDAERDEYVHAAGIIVATPEGRLSRYFYGIEYAPRDVRLGLVEASANRIGSVVDQILLFCFHYDPSTGRYGLVVMNVLRLGGLLTVALLAFFVLRSVLRERKGAAA